MPTVSKSRLLVLTGFVVVLLTWIMGRTVKESLSALPEASTSKTQQTVNRILGQLPLYFIENQGQLDESVAYYLQGKGTAVYFTSTGMTIAQTTPAAPTTHEELFPMTNGTNPPAAAFSDEGQRWSVKLDFVDANADVRPIGQERTAAVISYFKGQQEDWHVGLPTYGRIIYPELWPGIDLVYEGTGSQLKYSFIVQPGADPNQIKLTYRGATAVTVNAVGQMEIDTPLGGFTDETPVAYQEIDGECVLVDMAYVLGDAVAENVNPRTHTGKRDAGIENYPFHFQIGSYDRDLPLILDPVMIVHAGYIGGAALDQGGSIAVDGSGNVYVTGQTESTEATFPVLVGPDLTYNGDYGDAFVAKVSSSGEALVYAGYIGGAGYDWGYDIAVDEFGYAYINGSTRSDETTFPVLVGPDLTFNGVSDAFVAKVNSSGDALVYAGYIGGAADDGGLGITIDGTGSAYVAGYTRSDETTFPVLVGPDLTYNGNYQDAFVAKVNSSGDALVYAGYIGGAADDVGFGITIDGTGSAYVAGYTQSDETTFPVLVGPDLTFNGRVDAFVAKVSSSGNALVYAGYMGGADGDFGQDIVIDGAGSAYVTGYTQSNETTFPVLVGPDLTYNGGDLDAFVAKVNSGGDALVYAGYIGGAGYDWGYGIAVDGAANVYVTGCTESDETTFPVLVRPDLTYNGGYRDAFVAKVNSGGDALVYAGYIGGAADDRSFGIAVDEADNVYVTGYTKSDETTFPVLVGPDLTFNGGGDAFVVKLSGSIISKTGPQTATAGQPITYTIRINNSLPVTLTGVVITDAIPINATYIGGGTQVGNVVSWTVPSLAPGTFITRQFAVTATMTITNYDYRIVASGGFSATSDVPVVTLVHTPVAGLVATNDSPTSLGQATTLTATITAGSNVVYTWAFGDGQMGSGAVVTHTYPAFGMYTAVVTASSLVNSLTMTTPITIVDVPITGLVAMNDSPTSWGQTTALSATITTGTHVAYVWHFGDGQVGNGSLANHTYPDVGVYTAVVTASNPVSVMVATTMITITDVPLGALTVSNDSPTMLGSMTTFTAVVTTGTHVIYTWDFNDGRVSSGAVVTHTYGAVGVYMAVVTASNSVSTITATTPITVAEAITGLAATSDSPTRLTDPTFLTATVAAGSDVVYTWDFGDGNGGQGGAVTHTYGAVGVYTAVVTATNSVSAITATTTVTITEPGFTLYLPVIMKPEP